MIDTIAGVTGPVLIATLLQTPIPPPPIEGPNPPTHLRGKQKTNQFVSQTEIFNVLSWKAPRSGSSVVKYEIYRTADLRDLIGIVSSSTPLRFIDHNRKKGVAYTYFIVSKDQFGNRSTPATIVVNPKCW